MPGIPRKTQLLLLKSLEAQGCTVVYKKSGYQIRCPDGITTISLDPWPL